jgi:hypothetical protein
MRSSFRLCLPATLGLGLAILAGSLPKSVSAQTPASTPAGQVFSDSLLPGTSHPAGAELNGSDLSEGGAKWVALKGVTVGANGVTATGPAGAHHVIPEIAGTIHLQADINPKGSGFTGIALGRGDLTRNFWVNLAVVFYVQGSRYNINTGTVELIPHPDKSLVLPGTNHLDLVLNTVARTITAQLNGKVVLNAAPLPPATRLSGLTAAGFRINDPVVAGSPAVSNYRVEIVSTATTGLEPTDLGQYFVTPGVSSTLSWHVASPGPSSSVPYVVRDYEGQKTGQGTATLTPDHVLTIAQTFSPGYSEINFPEANQTFGIVALKAQSGPADPFFCMDSSISWLDLHLDRRAALVKNLARSGIAMARERLGVGGVNPAAGVYKWDGGTHQFESLRKMYADDNVSVLEIVNGGASYIGSTPGNPYTNDLPKLAVAYGDLAKHWTVWGGVEAFNEPDLGKLPADQYVPMVKCLSYGVAEAQSSVPVVGGVFATIPPGPFFDTCAANGMLQDSDVISFHSYDRAPAVEGMVSRYRAWLKSAGDEAMPLWHTECGWSWHLGPDRPPQDQDAISAMEISTKAVETMACGVARYFPFVYVYYEEGAKNFGMMGREATPLRSMAAYVECVQSLSHKKYLGDLQGLGPSVQLARVFAAPGATECVAVLYTGQVDPTAKIPFPVKPKRVTGADGRTLAVADGTVPIPDGLGYVWMDQSALGDKLKTDTDAQRLYQIGQNPSSRKRLASPLILRFLADQMPSRTSVRRYLISQDLAHALPINVRIQNLSQAPIVFTPSVALPGGAPQPSAAVTVPAMGSSDVSWKLDASASLDIAETRLITVSGTAATGIQPSALAIPIVMDGTMEQNLKRHKNQLPLPIADSKWQPNNSGGAQVSFSKTADGAWRMDVKSGGRGNWSYPNFTLPAKINTQLYSGFLMRARILKPASGVSIIAVPDDKTPSFWTTDLFPADGEWHVVYVPFAEFKPGPNGAGDQNSRINPAAWAKLQIGMGGGDPDNAMEISDLILVGGD